MEHWPNEFAWIEPRTWQRLLARAEQQGITLHELPRFRTTMLATSGTDENTVYVVGEMGCTCAAGLNGLACKHRALYLHVHFDRLVERYGAPEVARDIAETA